MTNAAKKPARPLILEDPATLRGKDKSIGGSQHDGWNLVIANHVINSLRPISDEAESDKAKTAAVQGLIGINPKDELEGMPPRNSWPVITLRWNATAGPCSVSRHSRVGRKISIERTSSRGRIQRCSNLLIATVARASRR